jgi:3-dehydroquinate dehydratase II
MKTITLLNGPNLNLLGEREPEIYGHETLADVISACTELASSLGFKLISQQTNHEGALIDLIQAARGTSDGIVINAGALTHTSVAVYDALCAFAGPVIEVHISNIHRREAFRHHSYISARADGVIVGLGTEGYQAAIRRLAALLV